MMMMMMMMMTVAHLPDLTRSNKIHILRSRRSLWLLGDSYGNFCAVYPL